MSRGNATWSNSCNGIDANGMAVGGEKDSRVLSLAHDGVGYRNGTYQFACGGEYLYVPHVTGAPQVYGSGNTAHGVSVVSAGDMVA